MKYNNSSLIPRGINTSLAASMNSGPIRLREAVGYAIYIKYTGAPTGTFKLQASVDSNDSPVNWEDLPFTSAATGIPGTVLFNIANVFYSWVRIVYTRTGGTGTITDAYFSVKGF